MSDPVALVALCFVQILASLLLAWLLQRFRPQFSLGAKILLAASPLPLVAFGFALWMMFGMGHITDLGAMATAVSVIVAVLLLPIGWPQPSSPCGPFGRAA